MPFRPFRPSPICPPPAYFRRAPAATIPPVGGCKCNYGAMHYVKPYASVLFHATVNPYALVLFHGRESIRLRMVSLQHERNINETQKSENRVRHSPGFPVMTNATNVGCH